MLNTNKINKAKEILKDSILKKKEPVIIIDTNIILDNLKYFEKPYNPYYFDVNKIIEFLKKNKLSIFDLECINYEVNKKIADLIDKKKLSDKSPHEFKTFKQEINYTSLYTATQEEKELSEKYGWNENTFDDNRKDNRTDLLIYLIAKRIGAKLIITSNYEDFVWCGNIYNEKINSNDSDKILILTPSEMILIIEKIEDC